MSAARACSIIADTIAAYWPYAKVTAKPMADGGEGTAQAMIAACDGRWIPRKVMGPLAGIEVDAGFAWFEKDRSALVEMASASGITLLSKSQLNPLKTTTFGTGQLIKTSIARRPDRIMLATGGSATVDMGVGAAIALGWKFLDGLDKPVGLGGAQIERIEKIIEPEKRLDCEVVVLSDVSNPLCGPDGAARVFAPQKGADMKMVERLEVAFARMSELIKSQLGLDVSEIPGSGSAGGLGAGAAAFMNARITSGIETIMQLTGLERLLEDAEWVITGEGRFDKQSLGGKVFSGIYRLARQTGTKICVIAGEARLGPAHEERNIDEIISLKPNSMTAEEAIKKAESLLRNAAVNFVEKHLN